MYMIDVCKDSPTVANMLWITRSFVPPRNKLFQTCLAAAYLPFPMERSMRGQLILPSMSMGDLGDISSVDKDELKAGHIFIGRCNFGGICQQPNVYRCPYTLGSVDPAHFSCIYRKYNVYEGLVICLHRARQACVLAGQGRQLTPVLCEWPSY